MSEGLEKAVGNSGCINHIGQRRKTYNADLPGKGDCRTCIPDENNKYCTGYQPATIYRFTVKTLEETDV